MTAEPVREVPISDARAQLTDLVNRAEYREEITYLTRRGRGRVAAVVPSALLQEALAALERYEDEELGRRASEAVTETDRGAPTVSWRDLRDEPSA
jgi:prevent-host-death family protein